MITEKEIRVLIPDGSPWRWCGTLVRGERTAMWWSSERRTAYAIDPKDGMMFHENNAASVFERCGTTVALRAEIQAFGAEQRAILAVAEKLGSNSDKLKLAALEWDANRETD